MLKLTETLFALEHKNPQIVQFIFFYLNIDSVMSKYLTHFQSLKEKEHIEHKELSNEELQSEIQDRRYLGELTRFMIRCFKETNFGQSLEGE